MKIKHIFFILLPLLLVAMVYADGVKSTSQASNIDSKTTVKASCVKACLQKDNCPHADTCTCGENCKCGDTCKSDSTCHHVKPDNCPHKAQTSKATTAVNCDPSKCAGCKGH